uniref:Uncharacterized protein n=1 Tax=Romanomermis culicivorax TaxID=13658 RepID=A0A915I1T1_ROMCU
MLQKYVPTLGGATGAILETLLFNCPADRDRISTEAHFLAILFELLEKFFAVDQIELIIKLTLAQIFGLTVENEFSMISGGDMATIFYQMANKS